MRQIAIKSRKAGILAGIFISVLYFLVPPAAHSYTNQDVQNYLDSHPAPEGCYNSTEEFTTNGERGIKIWRACESSDVKNYQTWFEDGVYYGNRSEGNWISKCDGQQFSKDWTNSFYGFHKLRQITTLCNGQINETVQVGGWVGLKNPCLFMEVNRVCPPPETTLLTTFFPIENCTDADQDGFYSYNATSCPQGNDCNDSDPTIYPGTPELCDGKDNNCNGEVDEGACSCQTNIQLASSANMASGNLHHDQELFLTKGTGLTTNITLHYNTIYAYTGSLGKGWTHTYDITLTGYSNGSILLRNGNERRLYTKTASGYLSQPGDYTTLTKNTNGTFSITHKDGTKYNFDSLGRIVSVTDRNGNTMSFTYADGDLTAIKDSSDRVTTLAYDPVGRITGITDPNGNTYTLGYINNMFAYIIYPNGGRWDYTYDPAGFMLTKTDPNDHTTTYTYDTNHRVTTATDPEGKARAIAYPAIDDTSQTKTSTFTEKDGGVWTYTYNTQQGTLTRKTDPQGTTTSYTYDASRNMTSKTEPDGSVTSYTYDINGNMTSTTDPMTQTTTYTYNAYGQVTGVTDTTGNTTSYEYDAKGNLTKTTDPTGATTQYQYDSKGNVTSVTNAAGQTTTFSYDQYGNLASIKDSAGAITSFTYDTAGNMISQTDASGNTTRFEYNSLNQLVKVIDPNGNSTREYRGI